MTHSEDNSCLKCTSVTVTTTVDAICLDMNGLAEGRNGEYGGRFRPRKRATSDDRVTCPLQQRKA